MATWHIDSDVYIIIMAMMTLEFLIMIVLAFWQSMSFNLAVSFFLGVIPGINNINSYAI